MSVPTETRNEILVRQARCQDLVPVGTFFLGLSPDSRYHRFLSGIQYVSPEQLHNLVTNSARQMVFLALAGETVVGHIMAVFDDEHTVNVGLVVADAYHRQGVGRRLVHELADTLAAAGVAEVCADVHMHNSVVTGWVRRLVIDLRTERSRDTLTMCGRLTAG